MKIEINENTEAKLKTFPNVLMAVLEEPVSEGDSIRIGDVEMIFTKDALFFCMDKPIGISETFTSARNHIESYRAMGLDIGQNYKAKIMDAEEMNQKEEGKFDNSKE